MWPVETSEARGTRLIWTRWYQNLHWFAGKVAEQDGMANLAAHLRYVNGTHR